MSRSLLCGLLLVLAAFSASGADGPAAALGPSDARAVRAVVEGQLTALAAEQDAQAFQYASPRVQGRFHDAVAFAEMVRSSYPMLIRPASTSFFRAQVQGGIVLQPVQFRDREGRLWRAIYELQRQRDKRWRIDGCAVAPDDESTIS